VVGTRCGATPPCTVLSEGRATQMTAHVADLLDEEGDAVKRLGAQSLFDLDAVIPFLLKNRLIAADDIVSNAVSVESEPRRNRNFPRQTGQRRLLPETSRTTFARQLPVDDHRGTVPPASGVAGRELRPATPCREGRRGLRDCTGASDGT
jgi:hypothetical protein